MSNHLITAYQHGVLMALKTLMSALASGKAAHKGSDGDALGTITGGLSGAATSQLLRHVPLERVLGNSARGALTAAVIRNGVPVLTGYGVGRLFRSDEDGDDGAAE